MNIKHNRVTHWISCNILNRHWWGRCGYKDIYEQEYYYCCWCHRIKCIKYDADLVARKSKEIHDGAFRAIEKSSRKFKRVSKGKKK